MVPLSEILTIWSISYDSYHMIHITWLLSYDLYSIYDLSLVTQIGLPKMTRSRQTFIFANKNDQKMIIMMTIITAIDNAIIY